MIPIDALTSICIILLFLFIADSIVSLIILFRFIAAEYIGFVGVIFAPALAALVEVLYEELYLKKLN